MGRTLPLTALLAWTMLQVPLFVCISPCGTSVDALFLLGGHSCHRTDSEAHQRCCGHRESEPDSSGTSRGEDGTDGDEPAGHHFVMRFESPGAIAQTALPSHDDVGLFAAWAPRESSLRRNLGARNEQGCDHGPPMESGPVLRGDRLQL